MNGSPLVFHTETGRNVCIFFPFMVLRVDLDWVKQDIRKVVRRQKAIPTQRHEVSCAFHNGCSKLTNCNWRPCQLKQNGWCKPGHFWIRHDVSGQWSNSHPLYWVRQYQLIRMVSQLCPPDNIISTFATLFLAPSTQSWVKGKPRRNCYYGTDYPNCRWVWFCLISSIYR